MIAILKHILLKKFKLIALNKTNTKHHLKLLVSFVPLKTKPDRARTQVIVQAQQYKSLLLLNHNPKVEYMNYVRHLSKNDIARHVKICDLQHNSNLSRLEKVTEKDLKRVEKYKEALRILFEVEGSSESK